MFMRPASADRRDLKSISASSSGVMPSPPPPLCHERRCPCPAPWPEACSASSSLSSLPSSPARGPPPPAGPHGEKHFEGRLEGPPVRGGLHQRGRQRVLQRFTVLQRN